MSDWWGSAKVVKPFNSPLGSRQSEQADPREAGKPVESLPERGVNVPFPEGLQGKPEDITPEERSMQGGIDPGIPPFVARGITKLGHVLPAIANGRFSHAANEAFEGGARVAAPFAIPAILSAPEVAAPAAILGSAGSMGGEALARQMGASPDQIELAGNLGGLGFGALGGVAAPKIRSIVEAATSPEVKTAVLDAIPKGRAISKVVDEFMSALNPKAEVPPAVAESPIATGRPTGGRLFGNTARSRFMSPPSPEPSVIVPPSGIVGLKPRSPRPEFSMGESTPVPNMTIPEPGPRSMFSVAPEYKSPFDPRSTRIIQPSPQTEVSPSSNPTIKSIVTSRERNTPVQSNPEPPKSMFAAPKSDNPGISEVPLASNPYSRFSGEFPTDQQNKPIRDIESGYRADQIEWGNRIAKADRFARELQRTGQPVPTDDSGWARFARSIGEREAPHEDTREMIQERMRK